MKPALPEGVLSSKVVCRIFVLKNQSEVRNHSHMWGRFVRLARFVCPLFGPSSHVMRRTRHLWISFPLLGLPPLTTFWCFLIDPRPPHPRHPRGDGDGDGGGGARSSEQQTTIIRSCLASLRRSRRSGPLLLAWTEKTGVHVGYGGRDKFEDFRYCSLRRSVFLRGSCVCELI